jgi:hypothetical protein
MRSLARGRRDLDGGEAAAEQRVELGRAVLTNVKAVPGTAAVRHTGEAIRRRQNEHAAVAQYAVRFRDEARVIGDMLDRLERRCGIECRV